MEEKKIKVNEESMTQSEFEMYKERVESKGDVKLVKVNEDTYRLKIQG